jgi:hypothetical protein
MKWLIKFYLVILILKFVTSHTCEDFSELPKDFENLLPYYQFMPKIHYRGLFFLDQDKEKLVIEFKTLNEKILK